MTRAFALGLDLRSDAITQPTDEMWEAMRQATLGWASVGEDASVRELEERGAIFVEDEDEVPVGQEEFKKLNADLAKKWPVIAEKKPAPPDAKQWEGVAEKRKLLET